MNTYTNSSHTRPSWRLRSPALAAAFTITASISAFAETAWRSSLYPETWTSPSSSAFASAKLIQDFSYAGYRKGEADLPNITGPIYNVVSGYGADPSGANDSTVSIQNAINAAAAAGGGVVYLPAGTFKVTPQGSNGYALRIGSARVVLRGAGPSQTFLLNDSYMMRGKNIIRVEGSSSSWGTVPSGSPRTTLTSDRLNPTTWIPVASVTGFAVGDWIIIRTDATDAFVTELNMADLWSGKASSLGGVMFHRQITAIDSTINRLTIDVPTRFHLKTRDNARVHKAVSHIEESGIENLSIGNREHPSTVGWGEEDYATTGNGSYDVHGSFAISFRRARNCWMVNVKSYRPSVNAKNTHILSNGVELLNCRGVTLENCDFQRTLYGGGGGNGYMYRMTNSNECLLLNCAARYNRHGFVFSSMACSGNVIHGGIAQVTGVQAAGTGTTSGKGCDHHMHFSQSNLVDGVQLDRDFFTAAYRGTFGGTTPHGQTSTHSAFWNLQGITYTSGRSYIVQSQQDAYGYIIGTRGTATGYSTTGTDMYRTDPVDHVEGIATGHKLAPTSLYRDQLRRRKGIEWVFAEDNFNAVTTNQPPPGWTVTNATNTSAQVVTVPSTSNKSLRFQDSNSSGQSLAEKQFESQAGLVNTQWKVMLPSSMDWVWMCLRSGTTNAVLLHTKAGRFIYRNNAGADIDIGPYTANTWHSLRVAANTATGTFDVWLDGVQKITGAPFTTEVPTVNGMLFGSGNSSQGTVYFDDIDVTN